MTGNISYDPMNHDHMVRLRAEKVARIAGEIPPLEVHGDEIRRAAGARLGLDLRRDHRRGAERPPAGPARSSRAHLRHLNPFPANLGEVLSRFDKVLLPEMNLGQLALLLRARYLKDVISFTKVQGRPFTRQEIFDRIQRDPGAERPCPLRRRRRPRP